MDMRMIDPVVEAFTNILPQVGFQTVEKTDESVEGSELAHSGVLINIGVQGQLKGVILIGMDTPSAMRFASQMMMGMEVLAFDSLAQSAISEMGNMICANACTNYCQQGITGLDISPPTLICGSDGFIKVAAPQTMVARFLVDGNVMSLYVGLTGLLN